MKNFLSARHVMRPTVWTGLILLIPLVMTRVDRWKADGDGWHWKTGSFLVMGALLFGAGPAYEPLAGLVDRKACRVAVAVVIMLVVLAVWIELAVHGVSKMIGFVLA
jgi:tryptophan-rich sensory protein